MASLIVRIIGMVYRIPMSNILGEEEMESMQLLLRFMI